MIDHSQRVAIVGIGAIFPGAPDLQRFWDVVSAGRDVTSEVPPGRWRLDPASAFDPAVAAPDHVYSTRGGFVEGFRFDPEGLDLDPALIARLDPMFHLALHAGRAAWRDANTANLDRSRVGVVFGNIVLPTETTSTLAEETLGRTLAERVLGEASAAADSTGPPTEPLNRFAAGLPAGLLARALGLGGGAFTLDAACASSLYALKLAADELLAGRADAMITGGLSRPDPLYTQMGFSQLRALSPTGRARPFDGRGDGLVVGEGAGMFVLKRLGDALQDGDHVYALVAAVGLSNDVDGGLLAPGSEGQLRAMRSAYEKAGWDPRDVDLIECHATGTPVGDAVEFQSLQALWGPDGWSAGGCVLGSHKANFGHALTASGAAGLLKVLLSLRHKVLPPTAGFAAPGPKLGLVGSPFRVLTSAEPWPPRTVGRPRRAAVSGFGFGGINAHALIEEWIPSTENPSPPRAPTPGEAVPIAVVGLGAHFGPCRGLSAFEVRVLGGGPPVDPAPAIHDWGVSASAWYRREVSEREEAKGYHLDSLSLPLGRFRIPPKELEEMLPQQLLALLAAAEAIEGAGWVCDRPRLRAGVFVGIGLDLNTTNFQVRWSVKNRVRSWDEALGLGLTDEAGDRWASALRESAGPPLTANRTMGALGGLIASRVAREFRIGGPSFTVSSEETSGLRALEVAVRLLRQGELDEAVVGAVDLTGDPRVHATSHRAGYGGLVRGDGAAALVLKRLDDAVRDGDRVHAVVRGVGVASGGTIDPHEPDPTAQVDARRRAYGEAEIAPDGDELVLRVVSERCESLAPERVVHVARSSPVVGHTGAASGLIGLVRLVISLDQQILPDEPGGAGPRYWLRDRQDGPRRASLEAIGVDGVAVHAVLEEPMGRAASSNPASEPVQPIGACRPAVFAIEADDRPGLLEALSALDALAASAGAGAPVDALARDWWASHPNDPSRRVGLAVVAADVPSLREALVEARSRVEDGKGPRSATRPRSGYTVHSSDNPLGRVGELAFVFPGIGNHFPGMGRDLSARWPEVFRRLDRETLRLRSQFLPASGWEGAASTSAEDHRAPILAQVALGTAVSDLLREFGVRPRAVVGYSLGESSALFATRAWTGRDEMHSRLDASPLFRTELCGLCDAARRAWKLAPGERVDWLAGVVPAPSDSVRAGLVGLDRAYLLVINTPTETVVGGDRGQVLRLVERLGMAGRFLPLPVVSTVHCPIARGVEDAYRALHLLETTPPPGVRFYSAGWGKAYEPDRETAAAALVAQALDTIDFPAVVRRAYDDGVRLFVETGPGSSCSRMIGAILADRPHLARSACFAGEDAVATVLDLLGRLVAERVRVDLRPLCGTETLPDGHASWGEDDPNAAPRSIRVLVGGRPFSVPPTPVPELRPYSTHANGDQADLQEHENPRPAVVPLTEPPVAVPFSNGSGHKSRSNDISPEALPMALARTASDVLTSPGAIETVVPADPLAAQLLATESARGRAHEAFLRVSGEMVETMANHLSFQIALLQALTSGPEAGTPDPPAERIGHESVAPHVGPETVESSPPDASPAVLSREQCLEFAVGSIGKVLGDAFSAIDAYPTRVRLPDEPLMLVDRVTAVEGEPLSMTSGRVVTEHDVSSGDWYLDCGKIPPSIAIESGQADLFLSGWLGIDFVTKGRAVYRLLDASVTFHRGLPGPGAVIRYDIRISKFFRQGDTHLFRFEFEGSVGGEPLLTMRDGCAGFFTDQELSAGQGIIRRGLDLRPLPGKRPDDWRELVPMAVESYDGRQVEALRAGDFASAFGRAFERLPLSDPVRLPGGRMTLVHRVPTLDPTGGRYGLGLIRSELDIRPDDWFLTCHFVDDRVMPGTLMYECCLHTLRIFLLRMGWVTGSAGVAYEPVPGVSSRLRCRGQVTGATKQAVFEVVIKEVGYGPEPYAIADAMMFADGKAVVEVVDMSLRLTGLTREAVERLWADPVRRDSATPPPSLFTRDQVLAFATGRPSEAFGERYRPFDEGRFVARLPAPPYSFLDRVVEATIRPFVMAAGGEAIAEYDVPADAWYFAAERQGRMPFAVLQEVALQACGWASAYMGSALTSPEDLAFRNLGGVAVALADVTPSTGTLTTRVKVTKVSNSAGMILQHYDFETCEGETPVYRGSTYFGFFRRESLIDQVGIREATPYQPTAAEHQRARAFDYPTVAPFPDATLRMIDRVSAYVPDGGPHGLGFVAGNLAVKPEAWYFKAHFYRDPVCPGSLGLESFLQLLKVVAYERWGAGRAAGSLRFEPVAPGKAHRWLYRGQVVPGDRSVSVQAVVTGLEDDLGLVTGDGHLSVDGRLIYQMNGFSLRLLPQE